MACEFHPIIAVDLQGATKDSNMLIHHNLGDRRGPFVRDGVEADETAEPVLTSQDILVPCRGPGQGAYQIDEQDLLRVTLAGGHMDTRLNPHWAHKSIWLACVELEKALRMRRLKS